VDVRLALMLAALAMGALAGQLPAIVQTFFQTFSREQFVVPICSAMGFAYVLRQTGCDEHLVQLLVRPIRRIRGLLVPGAVLVGFLVNIPIISQTSTAVTVGPVLIPLLRSASVPASTIGAALLLGSSMGGELFNPGAPELQTVSKALEVKAQDCVARLRPYVLLHLLVATLTFWLLSKGQKDKRDSNDQSDSSEALPDKEETPAFRINWFKAAVPLVPVTLLFLTNPEWKLIPVRSEWLIGDRDPADMKSETRLIGAAMLIGSIIAIAVSPRQASPAVRAFCEGIGYAFGQIISLIVVAQCLGEAVKHIGLADLFNRLVERFPGALVPCAIGLPLLFALVCGSGYASTQSLYGFFISPAQQVGLDPVLVGAFVSIGSAAGRTMSPVAAVVLMCGTLSGSDPLVLVRRVAGPLLVGLLAVLIVSSIAG
jgi:DcuC family C4-dicarboxylate transporter